jgi:hypothetical protein
MALTGAQIWIDAKREIMKVPSCDRTVIIVHARNRNAYDANQRGHQVLLIVARLGNVAQKMIDCGLR